MGFAQATLSGRP